MAAPRFLQYVGAMASRITKSPMDEPDRIPEGPELDALIKAKVEEALADPAPDIPMAEVFERLRQRHAKRMLRGA